MRNNKSFQRIKRHRRKSGNQRGKSVVFFYGGGPFWMLESKFYACVALYVCVGKEKGCGKDNAGVYVVSAQKKKREKKKGR